MDRQRTESLLQFIDDAGLQPSSEQEIKWLEVIDQLKEIVLAWIKNIAWISRLPKTVIASTSATVLTYGSYGLGVHGPDSDIDALCVGPYFATMEDDFFKDLHLMLENRAEVSELHCVKSAIVPLMRFKFKGISVDFPFARLPAISVPMCNGSKLTIVMGHFRPISLAHLRPILAARLRPINSPAQSGPRH